MCLHGTEPSVHTQGVRLQDSASDTFGDRLTRALSEAKIRHGLSQKAIAKVANVDPSQLSRWKKDVTPTVADAARLVIACRVNGHWLLTGEGPMDVIEQSEAETRLRVIQMAADGSIPVDQIAEKIRLTMEAGWSDQGNGGSGDIEDVG